MENRRKIRNYFVFPRFQFRFLALLIGGSLIHMVITGILLYRFLSENYYLLVKYAALDEQITELLTRELKTLWLLIAGVSGLMFVGILALGFIFSHRIAGAVYALHRTIRDVNDGKATRLQLRPNDEFQELAADLNELICKIPQSDNQQAV